MATPINERALPAHVEVPDLPAALSPWFDLLVRAESKSARWRRRLIEVGSVVDGRSAARMLAGYRYSGKHWIDEAGAAPGQWRREWIVLADCEGDPFIADISSADVPVLFAEHGLGDWQPRRIHERLTDFVDAIKLTTPRLAKRSVPVEEEFARNSSITVFDWGDRRDEVVSALVTRFPFIYQPHMFENRIEVPVVLTRRMNRPVLERVAALISSYGGAAEIAAAIPREPRPQPRPEQ